MDDIFDINVKLDEIILDNELDVCYPRYRKMLRAENLVRKFFKNIKGKALCIATNVLDVRRLKACFSEVERKDLDLEFVVCKQEKKQEYEIYNRYDCAPLVTIEWGQYASVILISRKGESSIGNFLRLKSISYIGIYDYFCSNGLIFDNEWGWFTGDSSDGYIEHFEWSKSSLVLELFEQIQRLKVAKDNNLCNIYLQRCFFLSLIVRDFILAKELVSMYKFGFSIPSNIQQAWKDILMLLDSIGKKIQSKMQQNIIMIWVDKVPFSDFADMPYLSEQAEHGISFDNMFTVTPFTHPTMKTLFCSTRRVVDQDDVVKHISLKNSKLLRFLDSQGYDFQMLSGDNTPLFDETTDTYIDEASSVSLVLWNVLRYALLANQPTFFLAHLLSETHEPNVSATMNENTINDINERYQHGRQSTDKQIAFYDNYFMKNAVRFFMSDHGREDFYQRFHTFFIIAGLNQKMRIKGLCSYLDFYKIVEQVVINRRINDKELVRDYVEVQDCDWLNHTDNEATINQKLPLYRELPGYLGIITNEHIYIKFSNGVEWLQKRDNFGLEPTWYQREFDICDCKVLPNYRKIISRYGTVSFVGKNNYYAKCIKKIYENALEYNLKKVQALNDLFSAFPERSIALRMGGIHTYRLYGMLTEDNRKKIEYIIDNNIYCKCACLGIKIISLSNSEKELSKLCGVVFSSKQYLSFLWSEVNQYPENVQIIDPYMYLRKKGFYLRHDLSLFEPRIEDYDTDKMI